MKKKLAPNDWHVMMSKDIGDLTFMPWITEEHAKKLSELMNEIEEHRMALYSPKMSRENGDGIFYYAIKRKK